MSKIIGISGISGAGKSTLTKALGMALDATTLFWDDFDDISQGPSDYVQWYETSRDYSAWHYDALVDVLASLKNDERIMCPATHKELIPSQYVIFDAPMGYKHLATGKFIDKLIYIDTPLDVALARRILRNFHEPDFNKNQLSEELQHYLDFARKVYVFAQEKEGSHLIINGYTPIEEQVKFILSFLHEK
jgi:uridine kinase